MNNVRLALVIPAYKQEYLVDTLNSLAKQTDKRFNVYIGDDASPYQLSAIVEQYKKDLTINYQFFPDNLGRINLVGQWNRCLKLIQDEEFFMLFSDDDIMDPKCIENFYKALEVHDDYDVYHFDINIIDSKGNVVTKCHSFPRVLSSIDFFSQLYRHKIDARMPEFIFRTKRFLETNGFIPFDLAYRTDNATVMNCAREKGIYTIPQSRISWRESGKNVSSAKNVTTDILYQKSRATIEFFNWVGNFLKKEHHAWPVSIKRRRRLIISELMLIYQNTGQLKPITDLLQELDEVKNNSFKYIYYYYKLYIKSYRMKKKARPDSNLF